MAGPILPDQDDIMSKIRKMNIEMTSPYNDGYMSWGIKQDLYILKFFLDKIIASTQQKDLITDQNLQIAFDFFS